MKFTMRLYRLLAQAFPHEFKVVYGTEMLQLGEDIVGEIAQRHGISGLIRLLLDIAVRLPIEYCGEMRRDLTYAVRTLVKSRGFAMVGIISLGLGISVVGISVSEVMNMILRDAPAIHDADRLVMVNTVSYPYIERYRDHHDLFSGAAAVQIGIPYNIAVGSGADARPERVFGQLVSPDYFSVIGVAAARGRVFSPDVDKPGSSAVVISDRFWREHFDTDSNAVGRTIRVNGQPATIVGIGPKDFSGVLPFIQSDVFVSTEAPVAMVPELTGDVIHQRDSKTFSAVLRLSPNVTSESAQAGLDAITRQLDQETLDPARNTKGLRVTVLPGGKYLPIPRSLLPVVLAFTTMLDGLLVTIACMNLANMQLARATSRRKEIAIRLSVGASRFRLIRQLITESVLLALCGGTLGTVLAFWFASLFQKIKMPFPFPVQVNLTPDWRTMAVLFVISLIAGVGFGLAPALAATKPELTDALKSGTDNGARHRRFGLRNILMTTQVAGSLTLLLITGVMIVGFQKTNSIEVRFDPTTMYMFTIDPVRDGYSGEKAVNLFEGLAVRLKQDPRVRDVVLTESAPFTPQAAIATMSIPSSSAETSQVVSGVAKNRVGADYFAALADPVLQGREFDTSDQHLDIANDHILPAVINQTAASAFFGSDNPVGRRIVDGSKSYEVVGVVKDLSAPLSQSAVGQTATVVPVVYLPLTRTEFAHPTGNGITVMIRSDHGGDVMTEVRRRFAAIDSTIVLFDVRSLASSIADTTSYIRLGEYIYGGMGLFGLILSTIGLAGVTAYSVARRRKEIGIRMALGARPAQVLRLVLREGASLVLFGCVLGLLVGSALSHLLAGFSSVLGGSFEAGERDPRLFIGAPILLASVAMLACYLPARLSTKIDPLKALREE